MSTTTNTPDCPSCGEPMTPWTVTERATPAAEDHHGFRCPGCSRTVIDCPHCTDLHHPDTICEPERDNRLEQAQQRFGGTAQIPGHGTVPIRDLEIVGESTPIYTIDGGCPIEDCNGDLVYTLERNPDFGNPDIPEAEFQPAADKGYDWMALRRELREKDVRPLIKHRIFRPVDHAHNARVDGPRYRQRSMFESVFSTIKRTLGVAVRARTWYGQFREIVLMCAVHNMKRLL